MPANYTHTTRAIGATLTAAIYNSDHQNHVTNGTAAGLDDYSVDAAQMRLVTDDREAGSEVLPSSLAGELERLRYAIRHVKSLVAHAPAMDQWYQSPTDIERKVGTGTVILHAAAAAPAGWLVLDGSAVSRATYAALFAILGTLYGSGDGSTTFNLPDMRGRAAVGAGQGSGLTNRPLGTPFGVESHALATSELPSHSHTYVDPGHTHTAPTVDSVPDHTHTYNTYVVGGSSSGALRGDSTLTLRTTTLEAAVSSGSHTHDVGLNTTATFGSPTTATGGGGAHNNMHPSIVLNFIIKT